MWSSSFDLGSNATTHSEWTTFSNLRDSLANILAAKQIGAGKTVFAYTLIRPCDNLTGYLHDVMAEWHKTGKPLPEAREHLAHMSTIFQEEKEMNTAWERTAKACAYFLEFHNRKRFLRAAETGLLL